MCDSQEKVDAKSFSETVISQCNQDQIKNVIAELAYIVLGEFGGDYNKLMRDYFPKKEGENERSKL